MSLRRSRQKLEEAAYFWEATNRTNGKHPEFGYYLSAFLSAAKSIGWVLQSELRGTFGTAFDEWWQRAKVELPPTQIPFSVLTDLRNQALKEGDWLPGLVVVVKLKDYAIEIHYTVMVEGGRVNVANESYRFLDNSGPPISLANPNDKDEVAEKMVAALEPVFALIHREDTEFDISSIEYLIDRNYPSLSFEQMMSSFREHVDGMRRIVADAENRFDR